jgi:hypothetical protein
MCFSNGDGVGAVLDRNGLRPSRYVLTHDGLLVMGSEVGTLEIDPADIATKGRLEPGRIFYADLEEGRIIADAELKDRYISLHPYKTWVETHQIELADLDVNESTNAATDDGSPEARFALQQTFGYSLEDMRFLLAPMAANGKEPLGSMGEDSALACLSDRSRLLFHYFKQNFAQVTNPAIDSIRERPVMTLDSTLGAEKNLLDETPKHAELLRLHRPVLRNAELKAIREIDKPGFKTLTLSTLYKVAEGGSGLRAAIGQLCREASQAIAAGANILILSDRGVSPELAPIPALLATGAVHHHLIRESSRTRCGLVVETGEAREVAHFALLVGYGAGGINPYLAFETVDISRSWERIPGSRGWGSTCSHAKPRCVTAEASRAALSSIPNSMPVVSISGGFEASSTPSIQNRLRSSSAPCEMKVSRVSRSMRPLPTTIRFACARFGDCSSSSSTASRFPSKRWRRPQRS